MTTKILAIGPNDLAPSSPDVAELPSLLANPELVVWVDMLDPGEDDRRILEEVFRLHQTSIDDMLADAPTPKLERFESYLYVVWHALEPGWETSDDFNLRDLDVMIGKNFLLTAHACPLPSITSADASVVKNPDLMRKGPAFIAYLVADVLTDRYLPLMERIEREIDALEVAIMRDAGPHLLEVIFGLKDKLQRLRRVGAHQRDVLARMSRPPGPHELELIPATVQPFFRDAYDNFVRVVDLNDSFREIVNSAMDGYLGMQGHKLNEIMKVLTLISTIMLPLTFIAGIYGMNFDPDYSPNNMPELRWRYGYFGALTVMAITAVLFLGYFRRKRWL